MDERFDYILFTNEISRPKEGVWQIRPIEYKNKDNTRICRYIKTHPDSLFPNYEVSVWIDSNIQILSKEFYDRIVELDETGILISCMSHAFRKCIYEEAFAVVNMMVEHEGVVIDWCHFLRKEKYPRYNGLCETGVLYRKHCSSSISKIDALWWEYINHFSRRDQLSYNFVLWKAGIPCHYFGGDSTNLRNTHLLRIIPHKDKKHNYCEIKKNEAWLMRHCWKKVEDTPKIAELYYRLYAWPLPHFWFALVGQYYRLKDRMK